MTEANSASTNNAKPNVDIYAQSTRVSGHLSIAGSQTNKPSYGYVIRTGGSSRFGATDVAGTFSTANYLDQASTTMTPMPGFGKLAFIASPTADAASLKVAIDALRTALASYGITSTP